MTIETAPVESYISSDWHLDHPRCIEVNKRPFKDVVSQLDAFIGMLDELPIGSTLYLLGDTLISANKSRAQLILNRFPKHVHYVFVLGNHDRGLRNIFSRYGQVYDYLEIKYRDHKVVLSHYPMYEWNRGQMGSIHCFGHCHGYFDHPGRAMDVGYDKHREILPLSKVLETLLQKPIYQPCHSVNNGLMVAQERVGSQIEKN